MAVKNLTVVLVLSVLMTACGGSSNKKTSSSASSVAVSSVRSSAVASSVAPSSVASSVAPSSVASSAPSSVASSVASSAPSSVASSKSSVASSVASSSSSSGSVDCEPNPDSDIALCDLTNWTVDGGNGGSFVQGPSGPIFTNGAPTGSNSWNVPGMYYKLKDTEINKEIVGKTLTMVFVADQDFKDTGSYIQLFIQQNIPDYKGTYCDTKNSDIIVGQEVTFTCVHNGALPADGEELIRMGFQLKNGTNYKGTLQIVDATWE